MAKIIARKYEVLGVLGRGGMGVVYQVRHSDLGRAYALKVLNPELATTTELVLRFRHEAQVMARLQHPNIVQVFDIDQDGDLHYFVMEYVQGRGLDRLLAQRRVLPIAEVLAIGTQVAQALAYAHACEPAVVHRDIKPANVLLEDSTDRVVVTDFGIAKVLDPQHTRHTRTGMFMGTLRYCAPEQLRGDADLDGRADLYSLGLLLYEMAAGCRFMEGLTDHQMVGKLLYDPAENVPDFGHAVPEEFRRIVTRAIAKDRTQRYPSASALLADLKALGADAQTIMVAEPARLSPVKPRLPKRGAALVALIVSATMVWLWAHPAPVHRLYAAAKGSALAIVAWIRPAPIVPEPPKPGGWSPQETTLTLAEGQAQEFAMATGSPGSPSARYRWLLDGTEVASTPRWHYQPDFSAAGPHTVSLEVSDSSGVTTTRRWEVEVADVNRPPRLISAYPETHHVVAAQGNAQFRVTARDPDEAGGDRLTYSWTLDDKPLEETSHELSLPMLRSGSFEVGVVARDQAGSSLAHTWDVEVPEAAPRAPQLRASPPDERITLGACEAKTLAVQGASPQAHYAWWTNDEREQEDGARLVFSRDRPGKYEVRVESTDEGGTAQHTWQVLVKSLPPSQEEAQAWLDEYRQALQQKDIRKLRELGQVQSDQQAKTLQDSLQARRSYEVRVHSSRAEALQGEVKLRFEQVDSWYDPTTYSRVVDESSHTVTLVRRGCGQVAAR